MPDTPASRFDLQDATTHMSGTPLSSSPVSSSPCQSCGACCACDPEWPRFSVETDEALDRIPAALVDASLSRMAWTGTRCAALLGEIAEATACSIYADRPQVCRDCEPGDDACSMARRKHGLDPIDAPIAPQ